MRRWIVLVALTLAACGESGLDVGEPDLSGGDVDPEAVAEEVGCGSLEETSSREIAVREVFNCEVDGEPHVLYTFNSQRSRNLWLDSADLLGHVIVEQGETWALVEDERTP